MPMTYGQTILIWFSPLTLKRYTSSLLWMHLFLPFTLSILPFSASTFSISDSLVWSLKHWWSCNKSPFHFICNNSEALLHFSYPSFILWTDANPRLLLFIYFSYYYYYYKYYFGGGGIRTVVEWSLNFSKGT